MPCFAIQGLTQRMGPLWEIRRKLIWLDIWLHNPNISESHLEHRCSRAQCLRRKSHYMVEQISKELFETPPASVYPLCNGFFKLSPNTHIKLQFVDQTPPRLSPFSKTCIKILILPWQYTSFTHLKDNIDIYRMKKIGLYMTCFK